MSLFVDHFACLLISFSVVLGLLLVRLLVSPFLLFSFLFIDIAMHFCISNMGVSVGGHFQVIARRDEGCLV